MSEIEKPSFALLKSYYREYCQKENRHYDPEEVTRYIDREPQKLGPIIISYTHSFSREQAEEDLKWRSRELAREIFIVANPKEKDT